jgi:hypothetical protein
VTADELIRDNWESAIIPPRLTKTATQGRSP